MRFASPVVLLAGLLLLSCEGAVPTPVSATEGALWNDAQQRPQLLTGALFSSTDDAPTTALTWLKREAATFHLDGVGSSLELVTTRTGLAGTYLRFGQRQQVGREVLPVFGGEVIVLVKDLGERREVRAVNLEHLEAASTVVEAGDVGVNRATERALALLGLSSGEATAARGVFVTKDGRARLAWQVKTSTEAPPHDWTVFIDAATGDELGRRDGVRFVDGAAFVFDMNPVASTGNLALTDNSDATSAALDAARFQVVLPRLDGSGNLAGPFASTFLRQGRVNSPTNQFLFSRDNLGFEQANVYFHLDRTQAHLQAMGFTNVNNRVQEAIVDAQTADNSYYSPTSERLNFGRGGVDDAEDADIITHEYGHSIQDNQVPGFGDGDEGAMGEGFGDYLAASFALALTADAGRPQLSDPACVGDWDGTSYATTTPKCLRRVDGTKHWPEAEVNEVHDDGEMWSAALWDLRGRLGGAVMDRLVIEHHFLLGTNSSFATAAQAVISTDATLNAGANATLLRRRFIQYGLLRTLTAPPAMAATAALPVSVNPRRVGATYPDDADDVQTVTVPGATALRLHFTRVELETHQSCVQQSCDNVYLTNADGDLFQVISGSQLNLTSVLISGDTVNVRLVSDGSQHFFGYQVDRVEVVGAPDDAGVVYDAGVVVIPPVVDAGVPDAGTPPMRVDAGVVDAGMFVSDGGMKVESDAGVATGLVLVDTAGTQSLRPALNRGCTCSTGGGSEAWLALAALGWWRRRR